ncbi:MAG: GNAT family N-acetyltransferase [Candidatus Bathyarchaeia archaeon]|jgi:ribosomal protein S18 acetylase RimI-like enzyme
MALEFVVRPADSNDLQKLVKLFESIVTSLEYYNNLAKESELKKYTLDKLSEKLVYDPFSVLIAVDNEEEVIGFSFSHFDDYTIWLDWFGVDPQARHMGIGQSLLESTFEASKKRGAHKIWCDSRSNNEPSKNLLRKVGFREIVEIKDHWYRQDFILWERFL